MDLSQKTEVMKKVNREVKVYNEDEFLLQTTEKLQNLYKELKDSILSIATNIEDLKQNILHLFAKITL